MEGGLCQSEITMEDDKRKYFRFECLIPVDLVETGDPDAKPEEALIGNVSREGMRLVFDLGRAFQEGDKVRFQIQTPEDNRVCRMTGEVIWSRSQGEKIEVGLRLQETEKCSKSELLDLGYEAWRKHQKEIETK
ncbi:MAG: PilZ domain protein [Candidatus Aminicenantes bacterium ADurb.Bin147]|nr:MAG: PilZ domain protein [Candidatus Aminicenantes bacterium ADurb.Bin147]